MIKNVLTVIKGEQKRKALAIAVGAILLLVLDIVFVFLPLVNKNFRLRTQIISIKENMISLEKQISLQDAIKRKLEALKNEQARYKNIFPREEEVSVLFGNLSTIAEKVGVDIIAVKPVKTELGEAQKAAALVHEVPIEITAKGGYHQLGQFINRLEQFDKFMEIKDVEIRADKTTPRRHFFRLLVSTYILKG